MSRKYDKSFKGPIQILFKGKVIGTVTGQWIYPLPKPFPDILPESAKEDSAKEGPKSSKWRRL